jgi:hypothetical protein
MRFDTADEGFRATAETWLASLPEETITDLQAVFRLSPGYYPTTLVALWRTELGRRGLKDATQASTPANGAGVHLPTCHPGDYEWRFTTETATHLLNQATADLPAQAVVAHLGTPTTFVLGRERYALFRHVLLERNTSVVEALGASAQVHQLDLTTDQPPALNAGAAILDPPWYLADTHAFLAATSHVSRLGARIVLCQPALATRPGVAEERATLLEVLPRLGYVCRAVDTACIRYQMPHFEAASLKVAAPGLAVPDDWRSGDMLTLEKISEVRLALPPPALTESWREVVFGPVRIKLRRTIAPDLGTLVPGDVLDTVSRRDPIRERIGFWTSGNRVFTLTNPEAIGILIELCHTDLMRSRFTLDRMLAHADETSVSNRIAHQLFDVLLIELQEHTLQKEA